MIYPLNINTEEAYKLWVTGYCFRAIGQYYNCSEGPIKDRLKPFITEEDREKQRELHEVKCPLHFTQKEGLF